MILRNNLQNLQIDLKLKEISSTQESMLGKFSKGHTHKTLDICLEKRSWLELTEAQEKNKTTQRLWVNLATDFDQNKD